jgi:4-amino-4-deoxy-L-arabinose transferase-like glycosyltransferase
MFRTVTVLLWIGFYLRICVAAWNGFIGPTIGAGGDASTFQLIAVEHSYNLDIDKWGKSSVYYPIKIGWFYPYALGVIYAFTTPSLFLGSFLSVVVWTASAFILVRSMRLLSFGKSNQIKAMLIYALLPSSIIYTSVTLREPYQLLFINLAIYAILKIYLNKSLAYWPVLFCAVIGMGILHGALFVFGVFLVVVTLLMLSLRYRRSKKHFSIRKLVLVVPLVICVMIYGINYFNSHSYGNYAEGQNTDYSTKIECFQNGLISTGGGARSNYKSSVTIDSKFALLYFVPVNLFQYFFEPMPWHIDNIFDSLVMLENILRAWLLWKAWMWLRSVSVQRKKPVLIVMISYLFLECMWSLGTVNWGNAVRHHIPSVGLLLIVAFAYGGASFKKSRTD